MKVTKTSIYTNRKNTMEIDITEEQYQLWRSGEDIDVALPEITYEQREFLLTGALPEEVDDLYDDDDPKYGNPQEYDWS